MQYIKGHHKPAILIELNLKNPFEQDILRYTIDKSLLELSPNVLSKNSKRHYSGWIFTQDKIAKVAQHFALLSLQKVIDGTLLLRFYDPAVLPQLLTILNPTQQKKVLGNVQLWTLLDGNGDLYCYDNAQNNDEGSKYLFQLGIDQQLENQLYCIGITNQTLKSYRKNNPNQKFNECETLHHIMPGLLRLISQGFKDNTLLVQWANIVINNDKDFDLYPQIQKKLKTFKTRYDFAPLLDILKRADWQLMLNTQSF
ncbi:DUF4123 domain-containing protein [Candidatus Schmidhempelia bombi str. Bimp]|uniref:DUF4123 domain-containing protein n=1 Tax=Candidatus Schmidhempelia bombi str. Bimp TaxID=1387197 RepID=A0AB94IAR3_9GAMM|nr:DUF4123 domain-containing protein [Candidatus Schmidhempelia bombi str. Bimp]